MKAWIKEGKIACLSDLCDIESCPRYSICPELNNREDVLDLIKFQIKEAHYGKD